MTGWDSLSWEGKRAIVLHEADYWCEMCQDATATHVDHIWPKALGGGDERHNLRAACRPCNQSKGDRLHAEDIEDRPFLAGYGIRHSVIAAANAIESAVTYTGYVKMAGTEGCSAVHAAKSEDHDERVRRVIAAVHELIDDETAKFLPPTVVTILDAFFGAKLRELEQQGAE